jgi:signal transduction histidine kinase
LVSDSEAHLRSVIANLEESRAALVASANPEAAQILAMAILQLRMRLHRVADSELKALCQAVQLQEADRAKKADGRASKDRPLTGRDSR